MCSYHRPVRLMAQGELKRRLRTNTPPENLVEEVESSVWATLVKKQRGNSPYERKVGKFRTLLRKIVSNKAVDVMRRSQHLFKEQPIDLTDESKLPKEFLDPATERQLEEANRNALLKLLLEEARKRVSPEQMAIFEMVKIQGESPVQVATHFGKHRPAIDKAVSRVMAMLQELARRPEYAEEFQ